MCCEVTKFKWGLFRSLYSLRLTPNQVNTVPFQLDKPTNVGQPLISAPVSVMISLTKFAACNVSSLKARRRVARCSKCSLFTYHVRTTASQEGYFPSVCVSACIAQAAMCHYVHSSNLLW